MDLHARNLIEYGSFRPSADQVLGYETAYDGFYVFRRNQRWLEEGKKRVFGRGLQGRYLFPAAAPLLAVFASLAVGPFPRFAQRAVVASLSALFIGLGNLYIVQDRRAWVELLQVGAVWHPEMDAVNRRWEVPLPSSPTPAAGARAPLAEPRRENREQRR